ncbi:MAG: hypothetical protein KatS3mg115_2495 [Candidatus Poribacteria bacterium]|nr:MAG: hypothetical protein KatS3mg115_2495 [Candidatus Poribacteria bacterium]
MSPLRRWTVLTVAAFYIGLTKSGFAGGTGILVTPLLAMVFPAKETVALVLPLLFLSDIINFKLYWGTWNLRVVAPVIPGAILGVALATRLLVRLRDDALKRTIGGLALLFLPIQVARMTLWRDLDPALLPLAGVVALGLAAGFLTGVFSTMAHLGGVITTIYFLLMLPPEAKLSATLVGTATLLYFVVNGVKLITYARAGIVHGGILRQIPPLLPPLGLGLLVGKGVNRWFEGRETAFVAIILAIVAVMGWKLLRTPRLSAPATDRPSESS